MCVCVCESGGWKSVIFSSALDRGTTLDRFDPNKKKKKKRKERELTQEPADFVEVDMGKVEVLNNGPDVILSNGVDGVDEGLEGRTGGDLDGDRDNVEPVLVLCSRHCCQCLQVSICAIFGKTCEK